jgi:hypothetical protein
MPEILCLYLDDSGTRNPDRKTNEPAYRDWFAQGGIIFREEDETQIRELHAGFCRRWSIAYPLHSVDIRTRSKNFSWLRTISEVNYTTFMEDLTKTVISIPALAHASVIDRPGYDARYRKQHREVWSLCKTAFSVVCERSAKYAVEQKRVVRVFVERGDKTADQKIVEYFSEIRTKGLPFDAGRSAKYKPMSTAALKRTLYDLKFKNKDSAVMQMADIFLYPIARGRYEPTNQPWQTLTKEKKVIDFHVSSPETLGVKYSCFELVDARHDKAGANSGSEAAPIKGTS